MGFNFRTNTRVLCWWVAWSLQCQRCSLQTKSGPACCPRNLEWPTGSMWVTPQIIHSAHFILHPGVAEQLPHAAQPWSSYTSCRGYSEALGPCCTAPTAVALGPWCIAPEPQLWNYVAQSWSSGTATAYSMATPGLCCMQQPLCLWDASAQGIHRFRMWGQSNPWTSSAPLIQPIGLDDFYTLALNNLYCLICNVNTRRPCTYFSAVLLGSTCRQHHRSLFLKFPFRVQTTRPKVATLQLALFSASSAAMMSVALFSVLINRDYFGDTDLPLGFCCFMPDSWFVRLSVL